MLPKSSELEPGLISHFPLSSLAIPRDMHGGLKIIVKAINFIGIKMPLYTNSLLDSFISLLTSIK